MAATVAMPCQAAWLETTDGQRMFMRGIAYSPYHPRDGWQLSPATRALDRTLIRRTNANTLVTWGKTDSAEISAWYKYGIRSLPQIDYTPTVVSRFANGYQAPVPVYVNEENRMGLFTAGRDLGGALKGNPGVLAISLGNEYAWSAYSSDLGFSYAGWDAETVPSFHVHLQQRFGTVENFNELTLSNVRSLTEILPRIGLSPLPEFGEWWLFMREAFGGYLELGQQGLQAVGAKIPVTYQRPCGIRWDPASEGCRLPFLDIVSGNVFYKDALNWGKYCVSIDRVISAANGRPVLVTETGAHSLRLPPASVARTLKQSVASVLLHPEIAGVGVYEYCDEWNRTGQPTVQDFTDEREHWGLVTGDRMPKSGYQAVCELFSFMKRRDALLQSWQSPPTVLVSQQDLDWWKIRGPEGSLYERAATELYRMGVSFRLADTDALLRLDPTDHPRLILCDTFLSSDPDMGEDVLGRIVSYIENGGDVFYISPRPWQRLYGRGGVPEELRRSADGSPVTRRFGEGRCTIIPTQNPDAKALRYMITDYLGDLLQQRPVTAMELPEGDHEVFWRIFEGPKGLWLLAVNAGPAAVPKITLKLNPSFESVGMGVREGDGARLARVGKVAYLTGLNTYALVYLGPRTPGTSSSPAASAEDEE